MNILQIISVCIAVFIISMAIGAVASALGCRFGRFLYERRTNL